MRIAVVFFRGNSGDQIIKVAGALSQGLQQQDTMVDVIDGDNEVDKTLTSYQYIIVGTASSSVMGGKISTKVKGYLSNCGMIQGKRSSAFIHKSGLRTDKTLVVLMKAMESEGMYLKNSIIVKDTVSAEYFGKKLHIKK